MKKTKILLGLLVIALGVFMFVYAGIDDSPGGQLIGMVVVVASVLTIIKSMKV